MKDNVIQTKSYAFALRIIKLYKFLTQEKREFVLAKQILRSGTSVGANVEEAIAASSNADFVNKLNVAAKEARETNYWLRLLKDSEYITEEQFNSIHTDCLEIMKINSRIHITMRNKTIG